MPLVFIPIVIFPFVFSKLVFFQILIGLTFPAYIALAWMDPEYRPPKSILYTSILAYFVALLISTIFSVDPFRSWWGNQERMNGLFTMLHFLAWLTMAIGLLKQWTGWRRLLNYEICLSVFMALVTILQKPFPKLLVFEAGTRVGGLLDNPIYMGVYQMFNLSFLAMLFLKTERKALRWLYIGAAAINTVAFFLTQSRGAFFGLAAMIGIFALYYAVFTKSHRARFSILGGALGFFGLYVLAYIFRGTAFINQNPILGRLTNLNATTDTRLIAWDIAWKGFLERPLTGWGFDAFHILFNLKYNPKSLEFSYYETWFDRAHNTIMDIISMTGIFGFITYMAIFVSIFVLVWKARKKGWIDLPIAAILTALPVGYFLQNLFVFDHPAAFSMSYLLFALVIAATRPSFIGEKEETQDVAEKAKLKSGMHAAPWVALAFVQVIALFVVWQYSVQPFRASAASIRANDLLRAGRIDEGFEAMKRAGDIPTPYTGELVFLLSRDIITLAEQGTLTQYPRWKEMYDYAKEITGDHLQDHPRNAHPLFVYARLTHTIAPLLTDEQERMNDIMLTEKLYLRALEVSPKRQQVHYGLARLYSQVGQSQKAYDQLKKTVSDNENVGEGLWYLGLVGWIELGKEDEGTANMLKAIRAKAPFQLRNVRDAAQLAQAAQIQGDQEMLRSVLATLPGLGGGSVDLYLDVARSMEKAGLNEERNSILNALLRIDPNLEPQFAALRSGSVETIDESIAQATGAPIELATTTGAELPAEEAVPAEESSAPEGPGPRR